MTCTHLQQLYQLMQANDIKVGALDVVRFVCKQCDDKEVCPLMLSDEYDATESAKSAKADEQKSTNAGS